MAEQATAASLGQGYLYLPLPQDASPTRAQQQVLARFMRRYTAGGDSVYLHDDVGGGRAVTTAAMLLLLHGQSWPAVVGGADDGGTGLAECKASRRP